MREKRIQIYFFCYCTLPETNNLPLKIGLPKISKMKGSSSNHQFSGAKTLVSGRVTFFRWKKATLWSFFLFPCQVWCLQRSYPQTEAASWASEDFWKYFCLVGAWENCCGVGYSNFFLGRWCTFGWCTLRVFFVIWLIRLGRYIGNHVFVFCFCSDIPTAACFVLVQHIFAGFSLQTFNGTLWTFAKSWDFASLRVHNLYNRPGDLQSWTLAA